MLHGVDFPIGYNTFIQATTASSRDVTAIKDNCILESLHETGLLRRNVHVNGNNYYLQKV